jgi:multiple sugar transport system permease protein
VGHGFADAAAHIVLYKVCPEIMNYSRYLNSRLSDLLVLVAACIILVPIGWIALAAFKSNVEVFQLKLFFSPTLANFAKILEPPYTIHLKLLNSAIVAFVVVIVSIPIATLAAYSLSRFKLYGSSLMLTAILATQFIPAVTIVLPFFLMFRSIGMLDTLLALILIHTSIVMPYAIWMIKGFIDGIPMETEEAALVDGATRLQVIRNIVLPMAAPGVITASIFSFILSWNEFMFALVLTRRDAITLPVGLALFNAETGVQWHLLAATSLLIMIPMIVLALLIQRHFVQGMTMGAVR